MYMYQKRYASFAIILIFWLFASVVLAQKTTEVYQLQVNNPDKVINYIVGDTFTRNIEIDVKQPYQLVKDSLPQLGVNDQGVELKSVKLSSKRFLHHSHYSISLVYQIFSSDAYTKKYKLQAHNLRIKDKHRSINIEIPEWDFRVSPIATHNEGGILQDISPYRAPIKVETYNAKLLLALFFCLTLISVVGLIYLNADGTWFPGMGGPFASSYRELQSIKEVQDALTSVHHAFNKTYKESLFTHNIDAFLAAKPEFKPIQAEILHFFNHSYNFQFGSRNNTHAINLRDVIQFCLLCRHCERSIK